MAAAFSRAGASTRTVDGRDHLDLGREHRAHAVASGMVNVFAAQRGDDGRPGRRVFLGTVTAGGLLPGLAARLSDGPVTMVAVPEGRAALVEDPRATDAAADADVAEATEAFARVMLPFDARAALLDDGALDALFSRAAELVAVDRQESHHAAMERARQPEAQRSAFGLMLGSMFGGRDEVLNVSPALPPMLRACRHVAVAAGMPLASIPRRIPSDELRDEAESFAAAARIGFRRAAWPDRWWTSDCGPLLGFTADGDPVALVPRRWGGYRAFVYEPGQQPQPRNVDAAFARSLGGQAVVFEVPLPGSARTLGSMFTFLLRGCGPDLLLAALVAAGGSVLNLAVPLATGILVSRVIPAGEARSLGYLGAVLASTLLAAATFDLVTRFLLLRVESRVAMRGSSAILLRALRLPLGTLQRFSIGDLTERLGVVEDLQRQLTGSMVSAIVGGAFSVTYLALMVAVEPLAGMASLAGFLVVFVVTAIIARRQGRHATDAAERSGRLGGFALQLVSGIERIRTTCTEENALVQWVQRYRPERRSMYLAGLNAARVHVLATTLPFLGAALLWWRFVGVPGGREAQVASFMVFSAAFTSALTGVIAFGFALGDIFEAVPLLARLRPILDAEPEAPDAAEAALPLSGAISVQGLRFAYPGSAGEVLRGVSFEASPGDLVAIVGPSGSGKSTLAQLLLGIRRPTAGKVLYDGQDLSKLEPGSVRRQIGVVGQHARIMPGSIHENIVGTSLLTAEDAWAAAEAAGLAEDIRAMPMQMHTFVNEQTLSGGQSQKLMIARALAGNPRILLFDEATSALDEVSQAHVSASLGERAVTRVVIAHRLSTVRHADCIHVLEQGEVVESGTYDELLALDGRFRELVRRQLLEDPGAGGGPA
jgi:NHLM bacteriocin system ABC transporter ATP-binding protein